MRPMATRSVRHSKSKTCGQKHPREVVKNRNSIPNTKVSTQQAKTVKIRHRTTNARERQGTTGHPFPVQQTHNYMLRVQAASSINTSFFWQPSQLLLNHVFFTCTCDVCFIFVVFVMRTSCVILGKINYYYYYYVRYQGSKYTVFIYKYIYIYTRINYHKCPSQTRGRQEETHCPSHRFRCLFLYLL